MADETTHRISPVKIRYLSHHLSAMSTTSPLLAIGLQLVQQSYPNCKPYTWFLSVGPMVCLRLPSDSILQWTPLPCWLCASR